MGLWLWERTLALYYQVAGIILDVGSLDSDPTWPSVSCECLENDLDNFYKRKFVVGPIHNIWLHQKYVETQESVRKMVLEPKLYRNWAIFRFNLISIAPAATPQFSFNVNEPTEKFYWKLRLDFRVGLIEIHGRNKLSPAPVSQVFLEAAGFLIITALRDWFGQ